MHPPRDIYDKNCKDFADSLHVKEHDFWHQVMTVFIVYDVAPFVPSPDVVLEEPWWSKARQI